VRKRFDLSKSNLDRLLLLIYGAYGAGKTRICGDFLLWARERGEVAYINIAGEDGMASLAGLGLGEVGETVETIADFDAAIAEYAKKGVAGVAIDSLTAFYQIALTHSVGEPRFPDPKKDGERARMLWSIIAQTVKTRIHASRAAAPFVLWVAPHDRSDDAITGNKGVTPDLPGKLAWSSGGMFDFVGTLSAEVGGPGKVSRRVSFAPLPGTLTRQRAPRALLRDIAIPEGRGGWSAVFNEIAAAFAAEKEEVKK
jgi:hypothetical protein